MVSVFGVKGGHGRYMPTSLLMIPAAIGPSVSMIPCLHTTVAFKAQSSGGMVWHLFFRVISGYDSHGLRTFSLKCICFLFPSQATIPHTRFGIFSYVPMSPELILVLSLGVLTTICFYLLSGT